MRLRYQEAVKKESILRRSDLVKVLRPSVDLTNRLLYNIDKKEFDTNTDVVASEDKNDISKSSDHVSLTSSSFYENVSVANKPK